ncbi:hypothetical protein DM02DRAFT_614922 [Periconia macrospinosa]|uniref:Uncharacterized protein n=1 Tax=Periconia macrospinosa TaxID=97972 RepID=A0A2V1DQH9_9PLEO|nr:hypothetical protein DM02DRAFT_614922 [Periconia macrospinosa]
MPPARMSSWALALIGKPKCLDGHHFVGGKTVMEFVDLDVLWFDVSFLERLRGSKFTYTVADEVNGGASE